MSESVLTIESDCILREPVTLESGVVMTEIVQRYAVFGEINADKSNVSLIFHALTGSARADDWWRGLIGGGGALDTRENAFICINFLGSCYGSTGANSAEFRAANNGELPVLTVNDIVRTQKAVLDKLGISSLDAVIGGSVGGMCALRFAVEFPETAEKCVAVGACELPAMGLALNHLQREALRIENGVGLARQIAMLSYKSPELFNQRFARNPNRIGENPRASFADRYDIAGYLDHQSEIFKHRFDAETFKVISKAMDLFEILDEEIKTIKAETYLVGISSDWLFPPGDVRELAERFSRNNVKSTYVEMISPDGHDAFLSDIKQMSEILERILAANKREKDWKI